MIKANKLPLQQRRRSWLSVSVAGAMALALTLGAASVSAQNAASKQLQTFIDGYVDASNRSTRGSFSAQSFDDQLAQTRRSLAELRAIDVSGLSPDEALDWEFAQSILRGDEIEQSLQPWKRDPRAYMQFNDVARAMGRPGDIDGRADEVLELLNLIPEQMANGQRNLAMYLPRFQELSLFMASGAVAMLQRDVPEFAKSVPSATKRQALIKSAAAAATAMNTFISFLKTELPRRPVGDFAIGKDAYNAFLKDQYLLSFDADSLYQFALEEFDKTVAQLEVVAKRIDPAKTWQQLAVEIKNDYPAPDKMIEAHQEWVDKAKQHVLSKNLIPIPWKERAEVVPRAEYLRKYSYYGNFSRARQPDAQGVLVAQWMINPFEDQWDAKTKEEYLVEHDYGVIIVTAPHETYAGHHVQGLYQMHNPRKLRRENGIAIFSEGWGLYNEQLMLETGFFPNDRIELRALQLRLWRNARVVWDVGIHTGKMSYEEAISLLSDKVGFLRWAAQLEVDGSAKDPVYRIGYYLGMTEILKMREEFKARVGAKFTLADFHERLLKVGNMPPALMRKGLMATLAE